VQGESKHLPEELTLYLQCKEYGTLLVNGGLLDQPYWLWHLVDYAGNIYNGLLAEMQEDAEIEAASRRITQEALANVLVS